MASTAAAQPDEAPSRAPRRRSLPRLRFHAAMALILTASMIVGFYFELPKYVLRPRVQFPPILAIHSAVFIGWMLLYLAQTLLVQTRQVRIHRTLGWLGVVLAVIIPPLGIATAIVMRRFDVLTFHSRDVPRDLAFLSTTIADIVAFTPCAWLGIALRKRTDYHRRLMYLSLAAVAETGFGRMPIPGVTTWFFLSNVAFYAAGMVHDRLTLGHVHKVYRWTVPLLMLDEGVAMYLWQGRPGWWLAVCGWLTGLG